MTSRPHDALFQSAFETPAGVVPLLRELLPAGIRNAIAWSTLERERGSFVGPELADQHNDLLFRARLRPGKRGLVFLLLEHQSTRDPTMPQRVLSYQMRIWDRFRKERPHERLPPILAVLVSHAPGGWTGPRAFEEMFDPDVLAIPELPSFVRRCSMITLDLAHMSDAVLQHLELPASQKLVLWVLRDARDPGRLLASFDAWIPVLLEAGQDRAGLDALGGMIGYMFRVVGSTYRTDLRVKLRALTLFSEDAQMPIYGILDEKERAETLAQGHAQGRIEVLRTMLRYKFRDLDAATEARLQTATTADVKRYCRRLLTADSLAEVFEQSPRRRAPAHRTRRSSQRGGRRAGTARS